MVKKGEKPQPLADPETERKRTLRSLSLSKRLLRRTRGSPSAPLEPSRSVHKLEGRDIVKRGQRKSRYLFSFPGLLAPLSGGRIGELADLGTRNPVLYLEFPKGRVKLFGTHVYPKNKYLTLQLTKSAKGIMCEDCFESLIVFPEAWWIGSKEENPEERQLEFPSDMNEDKNEDFDFKGGAGATLEEVAAARKPMKEHKEPLSPDTDLELKDMDEDSYPSTRIGVENMMESTPARQSARMAGKTLNYAESSGNDSTSSDAEVPDMTEEANIGTDDAPRRSLFGESDDSSPTTFLAPVSESVDTKKREQSSSLKKSKEGSSSKKGTLVQTTLSTLFEKAEKKSKRAINDSGVSKASGSRRQQLNSKKKIDQNHEKVSKKRNGPSGGKKSGSRNVLAKKKSQVLDDETEEISTDSQNDSDDDWTG